MNPVLVALSGFWLLLPAMLPNSAAVIFGGGTPVDLGRSIGGARILGDGKTWRGLFGGAFSGIVLGLLQWGMAHPFDPSGHWGFGELPEALVIFAALAFGSLFGDMLGSFIKRRLGIGKGEKAPVLDQYDFVIGAFLFASLLAPGWVWESFLEGERLIALVTFLVVIPVVHRAVNIIGYRMGKKDVPW